MNGNPLDTAQLPTAQPRGLGAGQSASFGNLRAQASDDVDSDRSVAAPGAALRPRLAATGDSRVAAGLAALADHIDALVRETRVTASELGMVLDFLTAVGHSADAKRQEWVLLADVLGITSLVADLHDVRPAAATPGTMPNPFYRADVPELPNGGDLSRDGRGERLAVTGRVVDLTGAAVVAALVEVWHANAEGLYENQEPDRQPEFNLRGRIHARADGSFGFHSVRPRGYRLPQDGPVGRLMTGLGYPLERPAHLHFRLSAPGFQTLTTQVFDAADPAIDCDAIFGVKPQLLVDFRPAPQNGWTLDLAFTLARDGERRAASVAED